MEVQTPLNSESLGGYPLSATGGLGAPEIPEGLRSGTYQDVPDAITNPVESAPNERPAVAPLVKRAGPPVLAIVLGVLVLVVIVIVLLVSGVFG